MSLVDDSGWPLVMVRWPDRTVTSEELDETLTMLARYYGRRHAVLHECLRASGLSPSLWMRVAAFAREYDDDIRQWVIASAVVAPSLLLRGVINTIHRLAPSPS